MFWFYFVWTACTLLIVLDVAWWVVSVRLLKGNAWRWPVHGFMALQLVALLSSMCNRGILRHTPKSIPMLAVIWHHFALAVLLPAAIVWGIVYVARRARKNPPGEKNAPEAAGVSTDWTRRRFIGMTAALAPPLINLGLTGVGAAQFDELRVRRFELGIPTLPAALNGMTIVQVSDMHVGGLTGEGVLRKAVAATNSLRPDLILHTGDLIDARLTDLAEGIQLVKAMESRYGQWLIEGNHDLFDDEGEFKRRVKAAGIPILSNGSAVAEVRGHPVQLFGLDWISLHDHQRDRVTAGQMRELMRERQPDAFPILLAHHPHAFDAAAQANLPLTLSGHTHGGQWMLDRNFGVGSVLFRYWSGLYTRGGSHLIVSNGVGNVFPIRVNAPAEIVHITLHCA